MRRQNLCLCIADTEKLETPKVVTSDWGYLRLRREDYQTDDVKRWADVIKEQVGKWSDAFVYFKHEEAGIGPKLASEMMELLERRSMTAEVISAGPVHLLVPI